MTFELDLASARGVFFTEARQLLSEVESYVLELEQNPTDHDVLNAAFRAAHTIKGSAGVFGLQVITHFVHTLETVLDRVRNGEIVFDATMSTLVLECRDHIAELVDSIEAGADPERVDDSLAGPEQALTRRLQAYLPDEHGVTTASELAVAPPVSVAQHTPQRWRLELSLGRTTLMDGFDPLPILNYLSGYCVLERVEPLLEQLPPFSDMDPEACYLGLRIELATEKTREEILDAFEFMSEDSRVNLQPVQQHTDEKSAIAPLGNALPETLPPAQAPTACPVPSTQASKGRTGNRIPASSPFIRVPSDKLDALINLVGELVIANAGTVEQAKQLHNSPMLEATSAVASLIEEIRDGALGLRMVQIGETFQRFQRVVRDTSMELGKQIQLEITGEDTELDKSVVEKIGDPLMHLVRNALDHGLETPEVRQAAGKSPTGKLGLHAYHDSGHIVIEVSDDGRGLVREKIVRKAIEKGIITSEQTLSDAEVNMLIFAPGFSTADKVTDISGRGVGMDVVKKNIEALRGSVQVRSKPGQGCVFEIRLPLTLAIIDGFMIGVGGAVYVIPLSFVRECLELPPGALGDDDRMDIHYDLRGEFLPCVRLRKVFQCNSPRPRRENIIVVSFGGIKAGIVADQLLGESQTVIKPLGNLFEVNRAISGATIRGNGDVALIIDIPKLITEVTSITQLHSERLNAGSSTPSTAGSVVGLLPA